MINQENKTIVSNSDNTERIIVSLTSYPDRIKNVIKTIKTLLIQNMEADKVILWLAKEQFPDKENDLPPQLLNLTKLGLSIRWCDDLKPHKKYFYAMQEFPNHIIITVDDDAYYSPRLIESLYASHIKYPKAVICTRANRMCRDGDGQFRYADFQIDYRGMVETPISDILPTGVGGILYPPGIMPKETFNKEKIIETCLYQDDIWLKAMEAVVDVPTVISETKLPLDIMLELQEDGLYSVNQAGGNDKAFAKVSDYVDKLVGQNNGFQKAVFESRNSIENILLKSGTSERKLKEDFEKLFTTADLYIYGAGQGAHLVMEILEYAGNHVVPKAFLVTSKEGNPDRICDIPVYGLEDITCPEGEYFIIVSPAEKHHKRIIKDLIDKGWRNIIPIHDEWMGELIWSHNRIIDASDNILFDFIKVGSGFV